MLEWKHIEFILILNSESDVWSKSITKRQGQKSMQLNTNAYED